jgi:hypothetical protein
MTVVIRFQLTGIIMRHLSKKLVLYSVLAVTSLFAFTESAQAVPSYSRRYNEQCSTCHSMWGALTPAGLTFKLSGYRAIFGKDLTPVTPDAEISKGVTIPQTLPLSFVTGVGVDSRSESRTTAGAGGATSFDSSGATLALMDASIFMTSPIGKNIAAFVEFPMYETRTWEFTPTGNYEARFAQPTRQTQFGTESPTFEVAKFFWNNPLGEATSRDSFNFLAGITHLPLAYSPGKVRLSVNQYLIYERTALELLSPRKVSDVLGGDLNDNLFRLSEPQGIFEVFGMKAFGDKAVTDVGNKETVWGEYHVGMSNGSNAKASHNPQKDFYARGVVRYYGQSFGLFGVTSPDTYNDALRNQGSLTSGGTAMASTTGIMSGAQVSNQSTRWGPDFTLSLVPWGIPLSLENQYMFNRESDPTGFGKEFTWRGGFSQLNWRVNRKSMAYARYDYLSGDAYDDTTSSVNGNTGLTRATPTESDWVIGYQHLIEENMKFVAEYRSYKYDDASSGAISAAALAALGPTAQNTAHMTNTGFTVRLMIGF